MFLASARSPVLVSFDECCGCLRQSLKTEDDDASGNRRPFPENITLLSMQKHHFSQTGIAGAQNGPVFGVSAAIPPPAEDSMLELKATTLAFQRGQTDSGANLQHRAFKAFWTTGNTDLPTVVNHAM